MITFRTRESWGFRSFLIFCVLFVLITGCSPRIEPSGTPEKIEPDLLTHTPFMPLESTDRATVTRAFTTTPTSSIERIWLSEAVPPSLSEIVALSGAIITTNKDEATQLLDVSSAGDATTTWIYVLVSPFPTITDTVPLTDIQATWTGIAQGPFAGIPLRMSPSTLAAFTSLWGIPASGAVLVEPEDQILDHAWSDGKAWAIIPFEELEPRWKVIDIDGISPINSTFESSTYPLVIPFHFNLGSIEIPASNFSSDKLTRLIMTGVTALVRSTAGRMETKGLTYPGEEVRDIFRSADLLHISNEVSFKTGCPDPFPIKATLLFCSDPSYIALLEDIGTDIVELTGNHLVDYGREALVESLDIYSSRGWITFGGGLTQVEARSAKIIEHHGNKLAFIGCNIAGPDFAWAGDDKAGSAWCDFDAMGTEIRELRESGYLPIFTYQYYESYALYPTITQSDRFYWAADAGAVIVSGSQSHFPQYMEFYNNAYIHYGLGNLFFDQMDYPVVGTRREFADVHVFYDGKHISTDLLTFMLEDYAQPRLMTESERELLLEDIFYAGGLWRIR